VAASQPTNIIQLLQAWNGHLIHWESSCASNLKRL